MLYDNFGISKCPCSLMDRMLACEAGDPGSIPGEDTIYYSTS